MSSAPLISIIMPAHHSEAFIARSVQSVLDQTYQNWELIIVADDLGDYEKVLCEQGIQDARIKHVSTRRKGGGPSNARNIGLDAASADYIALLDSDDLFHREKLERCLPLVQQYGFVVPAYQEVILDGDEHRNLSTNFGHSDSRALTREEDVWILIAGLCNATSLHDRRRVPLRWAMNLRVMEDLLFALEAYHHISGIYFHNEVLHYYVNRSGSLTRNADTPAKFIKAKQTMIEMLEENPHSLKQYVHEALMKFLKTSLKAEEEYSKHCGSAEDLASNSRLFQSILYRMLQKENVQLPDFVLNQIKQVA